MPVAFSGFCASFAGRSCLACACPEQAESGEGGGGYTTQNTRDKTQDTGEDGKGKAMEKWIGHGALQDEKLQTSDYCPRLMQARR